MVERRREFLGLSMRLVMINRTRSGLPCRRLWVRALVLTLALLGMVRVRSQITDIYSIQPLTRFCSIVTSSALDFRNVSLSSVAFDGIQTNGDSSSIYFGEMNEVMIGDLMTTGNSAVIYFYKTVTNISIRSITTRGEYGNLGFVFYPTPTEGYRSAIVSSVIGPIQLTGSAYASFGLISSSMVSSISASASRVDFTVAFRDSIFNSSIGNIVATGGTDLVTARIAFFSPVIRSSQFGVICATGTASSYVLFCENVTNETCSSSYFLDNLLTATDISIEGVYNNSCNDLPKSGGVSIAAIVVIVIVVLIMLAVG
mmetsp:Transcript_2870/g.5372  ORF Transcript_2870/g.5372 Transcript_2870/m.5372 type:complete len:314 (-) Transcript_2870:560-1501(-)